MTWQRRASARLYSSSTHADATDPGDSTTTTLRTCPMARASAPGKRSPGRICSLSSQTRRPLASRARFSEATHSLSPL